MASGRAIGPRAACAAACTALSSAALNLTAKRETIEPVASAALAAASKAIPGSIAARGSPTGLNSNDGRRQVDSSSIVTASKFSRNRNANIRGFPLQPQRYALGRPAATAGPPHRWTSTQNPARAGAPSVSPLYI